MHHKAVQNTYHKYLSQLHANVYLFYRSIDNTHKYEHYAKVNISQHYRPSQYKKISAYAIPARAFCWS